MFDTLQVGKRIREARIKRNLTQTAVADAMGVSFQAVSNWERGNSMPDIAKIPELCELLNVTFDELVGVASPKETRVVKKVMTGETVTPEEAATVAPLLSPETVRESAEQAKERGESLKLETLLSLAPYLDEDDLDALAKDAVSADLSVLCALAPFLSERTLSDLAKTVEQEDFSKLVALAPFLSDETLNAIALRAADHADVDSGILTGLAPFLSDETLNALVNRMLDAEGDPSTLVGLAPFLSSKMIKTIIDRLAEKRNYDGIASFTPFL